MTYNEKVRSKKVGGKAIIKELLGWRKALSEKNDEKKSKIMLMCFWKKMCLRHARMHPHWGYAYSTRLRWHLACMCWRFLLTRFWQIFKEKEERKKEFDSGKRKVMYLSDFRAFIGHWNHWKAISSVILHVLWIYTYGIELFQHEYLDSS